MRYRGVQDARGGFMKWGEAIIGAIKWVAIGIIMVLLGRRAIREIKARIGKVDNGGDDWRVVDQSHIEVQPKNGKPVRVELPENVTANEVVRAEVLSSKSATVEVLHDPTDRRRFID